MKRNVIAAIAALALTLVPATTYASHTTDPPAVSQGNVAGYYDAGYTWYGCSWDHPSLAYIYHNGKYRRTWTVKGNVKGRTYRGWTSFYSSYMISGRYKYLYAYNPTYRRYAWHKVLANHLCGY